MAFRGLGQKEGMSGLGINLCEKYKILSGKGEKQ